MSTLWLHFGPLVQWAVNLKKKKSFEWHIKAPSQRIRAFKDTISAPELTIDLTYLKKISFLKDISDD